MQFALQYFRSVSHPEERKTRFTRALTAMRQNESQIERAGKRSEHSLAAASWRGRPKPFADCTMENGRTQTIGDADRNLLITANPLIHLSSFLCFGETRNDETKRNETE